MDDTLPLELRDPTELPHHLREALNGRQAGRAAEPGPRARVRALIVPGAGAAAALVGAAGLLATGLWSL